MRCVRACARGRRESSGRRRGAMRATCASECVCAAAAKHSPAQPCTRLGRTHLAEWAGLLLGQGAQVLLHVVVHGGDLCGRRSADDVEYDVQLVQRVRIAVRLVGAQREARFAREQRRAIAVIRHALGLHRQQLREDAAHRPHVHRDGVRLQASWGGRGGRRELVSPNLLQLIVVS